MLLLFNHLMTFQVVWRMVMFWLLTKYRECCNGLLVSTVPSVIFRWAVFHLASLRASRSIGFHRAWVPYLSLMQILPLLNFTYIGLQAELVLFSNMNKSNISFCWVWLMGRVFYARKPREVTCKSRYTNALASSSIRYPRTLLQAAAAGQWIKTNLAWSGVKPSISQNRNDRNGRSRLNLIITVTYGGIIFRIIIYKFN